jgi:coenzyme F420-reducing hydrogenase delta subunit
VLLGFQEERLQFHQVHAGEATALAKAVRAFVEQLAARQQE